MPLKKGFKKMNLNVEVSLHNQFKAAAAAQGQSMTDVLLAYIQTYVAKHLPPALRRTGGPK